MQKVLTLKIEDGYADKAAICVRQPMSSIIAPTYSLEALSEELDGI